MSSMSFAVASVTLFDFEDGNAPSIQSKAFSVGVTNVFATSGSHSLHFRCAPWRNGMYEWMSFTLRPAVTNWSKYNRLVVDYMSIGVRKGSDRLTIELFGPEGGKGVLRSDSWLPSRMSRQWVVGLKKWPDGLNPANIARIKFVAERPLATDIFIDRIMLLEPNDPLPGPESMKGMKDMLAFAASVQKELVASNDAYDVQLAHSRGHLRFCALASATPFMSGPMAVGTATSMEKILPRDRSFEARTIPAEGLSVRLARNEYESVQVLVTPFGQDLTNVRVRVKDDLVRQDGTVFAATNIVCPPVGYVELKERTPDVRVGKTMPSAKAPGYLRTAIWPQLGWWPDPILEFMDGVDVKGTDLQSFWVRVRCPAEQGGGIYRGTLVVSADGVPHVEIPLSVRVNGFALGRTSALPLAITFFPATNTEGKWYHGVRGCKKSPINMWSRHRMEWVDFLADYLISADSLYYGGGTRFDMLERLKEQGRLGLFNLCDWNYPRKTDETGMSEWRERLVERLKAKYAEAKARGLLEHAYIYGCDEVTTNHFPAIKLAVDELKKAAPGVPLFTTALDESYGMDSPIGGIDWFCPLTEYYDFDKAETARKGGHKVWWYVCCGPGQEWANFFIEHQAIAGRLLLGAQALRMRPDGFLYYQISHWNGYDCIENGPFTNWEPRSYKNYHGDGSLTCVGPDGTPLPTLRLENFRDGLEDYAYTKILETKLAKRSDKDDEWSRKAKDLIAVPREVMDTMTNYTDDPAVIYRWRDEMADLIEKEK